MFKRTLSAALLALVVSATSGCYCCFTGPCGSTGPVDWVEGWKARIHDRFYHGEGGCGPLGCLGCKGCGESYWSEWFNDPPACHDPCDHCGNWVGHGAPGSAVWQMPHDEGHAVDPEVGCRPAAISRRCPPH